MLKLGLQPCGAVGGSGTFQWWCLIGGSEVTGGGVCLEEVRSLGCVTLEEVSSLGHVLKGMIETFAPCVLLFASWYPEVRSFFAMRHDVLPHFKPKTLGDHELKSRKS